MTPNSVPDGPAPACCLPPEPLATTTKHSSTENPTRVSDRPDAGPSVEPNFIGVRLLGFAPCWQGSTSDAWVLETVTHGYRIEFHSTPPRRFWQVPFSTDPVKHSPKLLAIQHLLDIQAIERVPRPQMGRGVYSVFFLVPKKNGDMRTILDLKWLNRFIIHKKFKMETWRTITTTLDQGDFLTSIDLSEAYLHIPIHPSRRKFIRFSYGHHHYQYRALPFVLSSAPRVFTKILVAPVAKLRSQGVCVFPYLDDLVAASSFSQASEDLQRVMTSFTQHGFVINESKSSLFPSQKLIHLGLLIDTQSFQVSLSPERQSKLREVLLQVRSAPSSNLMTLSSLLGLMVSCQDILPWSRLHLRPLQSFLLPFSHLIETKTTIQLILPSSVKDSLNWWLNPSRLQTGLSLEIPSCITITTDASLWGWRTWLNHLMAQGTWSLKEQRYSINRLELRAIRLALLQFKDSVQAAHVLIRTDNTSAKALINRQGGTKSKDLMREATLPSTVDEEEWSLHLQVFHLITTILGKPEIDLFASTENHQVPAFLSRNPSPLVPNLSVASSSLVCLFSLLSEYPLLLPFLPDLFRLTAWLLRGKD